MSSWNKESTKEGREKISKIHKGIPLSEDHKNKIRIDARK